MSKSQEIIDKLVAGEKLFEYKSFKMSGNSLTSKILPGHTFRYKFEDGTKVHFATINALRKKGLLKKGNWSKTLGGGCTELIYIQK